MTDSAHILVDVSEWQSEVSWSELAAKGIAGAMIRALYGIDHRDLQLTRNALHAHRSGVRVGYYQYATPGVYSRDPEQDAQRHAEALINVVRRYPCQLGLALDLEEYGDLQPDQLAGWARAWADAIRAAESEKPILYTNFSMLSYLPVCDVFRLWLAWWVHIDPQTQMPTRMPEPEQYRTWELWAWQYTDRGRMPGIYGNVDLSLLMGHEQQEESAPALRASDHQAVAERADPKRVPVQTKQGIPMPVYWNGVRTEYQAYLIDNWLYVNARVFERFVHGLSVHLRPRDGTYCADIYLDG